MKYNGGDGSLGVGCSAKVVMVAVGTFVILMWVGYYFYMLWVALTTTDVLVAIRCSLVVVLMSIGMASTTYIRR